MYKQPDNKINKWWIFESSNNKTNVLNAQFVPSLFHYFQLLMLLTSLRVCWNQYCNRIMVPKSMPNARECAHLQCSCTCIVSPMPSHFSSLSLWLVGRSIRLRCSKCVIPSSFPHLLFAIFVQQNTHTPNERETHAWFVPFVNKSPAFYGIVKWIRKLYVSPSIWWNTISQLAVFVHWYRLGTTQTISIRKVGNF